MSTLVMQAQENLSWTADIASEGPLVRIAPGRRGVSIWSRALFASPEPHALRAFLAHVFSVEEVVAVEIDHRRSFGRLRFGRTSNAVDVWRRLGRALRGSQATPAAAPAEGLAALHLEPAAETPLRVYRLGSTLTSWRASGAREGRVRLAHPALFTRADVAYRLEEELAATLGVDGFRVSALTGAATIRFDPQRIDAERLVRRLDRALPRLLSGPDAPPAAGRFVAAAGLLGLAGAGQFAVPALRPLAVLGVAIYGAPNVANAARQATQFKVGLPALYTMGLAFMLASGAPFPATVMATLMQFWPRLTFETMKRRHQRLFAVYRREPVSARLLRDDVQILADVATLAPGDLIVVEAGEPIPVDGVVSAGLAAVDEETLTGEIGAIDKSAGDRVFAASFIRSGRLVVRVERAGAASAAGAIAARLPRSRIAGLPASAEAERVANRNAQPAIAVAAASFIATRVARPSQAVIRPDYATAPRLAAQLGALHGIADALSRGLFFRNPAALDRLAATDVYVFDDGCDLERRNIEVADVICASGVAKEVALGYAAATYPATHNERSYALLSASVRLDAPIPAISGRARHAGAVRYVDAANHVVDIASPAYVEAAGLRIPPAIAKRSLPSAAEEQEKEHLLRPLWVILDGEPIGVVTFRRSAELEAKDVVAALAARNPRARFIHMSSEPQVEAERRAFAVGVRNVSGDLDPYEKARMLRRFGRRTLWVGDGASPDAKPAIEACGVSLSVSGLASAPDDRADILGLQPGLVCLAPLRRIGQARMSRLRTDSRMLYAANVAGAAGGFVAGFGGFEAGIVSNLGAAAIYAAHWKRLSDLTRRIEERRAIVAAASGEEMLEPPWAKEIEPDEQEGFAPSLGDGAASEDSVDAPV